MMHFKAKLCYIFVYVWQDNKYFLGMLKTSKRSKAARGFNHIYGIIRNE